MTEMNDHQKSMTNIDYLIKKKPEKLESKLHVEACDYIKTFYPSIYFDSDPSGLRVPAWLRVFLKNTRSEHKHLDITILEPSREFKALIIELKKKSIYKKDGTILKNDHLTGQETTKQLLESKGYLVCVAWDIERVKEILHNYLGKPKQDNTPLFS